MAQVYRYKSYNYKQTLNKQATYWFSSKQWIIVIAVLALMNILLFWPTHLYFLNDDLLHIPLTDENAFLQRNSVRPVHELLVKLDLLIWDKNSVGFHITAMLLHFIVCFQMFDLFRLFQVKWMKTTTVQAEQTSFLAVALFLIYPQHTEGFAWILGRTPVLSAVFLLITLRIFLDENITSSKMAAGVILFAATLFTYEQSILLPLLLLVVAFNKRKNSTGRMRFVYVLLLMLIVLVYIICRKLITTEIVGAYEGGNFVSFQLSHLIANTFRIIGRLWLNPSLNTIYFLIGWGVSVAVIIVVCIKAGSVFKPVGRSLLLFLAATLLLIAPIISLGVTIRSFESGRYLYLPSIFFVIMISIGLMSISIRFKAAATVLVIVIALYWMAGKVIASADYRQAAAYVKNTNKKVLQHFAASSDTLVIDTLRLTVKRLPVYRLGFNSGIHWLNPSVDTNRIIIHYYHDEFTEP